MKNEKLFNETIDKLVKAYFEGTLRHRQCSACAVGNIIGTDRWMYHFYTSKKQQEPHNQAIPIRIYRKDKEYIQAKWSPIENPFPYSDYSMQELMEIEWAFETADMGKNRDDWEFNGLMKVVEVLQKIHECDAATTTATKERFIKVKV